MADIKFIINEKNEIAIEGLDFTGSTCHDEIEKYVKQLGEKVVDKKKPEFYQAQKTGKKQGTK
jgi:Protein of unknown function (DUF2997)